MTSSSSRPVLVVLGAGPGLGMSVAQRFGTEGYTVALISRSADRHADYLHALDAAGVDAAAFTADADDPAQLRGAVDAVRKHFGRIDVGYYGPAATMSLASDITTLTATEAEAALKGVLPAVDFASQLIPELIEGGDGGLLFAGGLSSVIPMPPLAGLALFAAALRNYAITLNAALAPAGVYAGTITIGGLIERGDIHTAMRQNPAFGDLGVGTLNPDDLAETVWRLYSERSDPEAVVTA